MKGKELRDESTEEKKKIWEEVDQAASHAPEWVVSRIKSRGQAKEGGTARSDSEADESISKSGRNASGARNPSSANP